MSSCEHEPGPRQADQEDAGRGEEEEPGRGQAGQEGEEEGGGRGAGGGARDQGARGSQRNFAKVFTTYKYIYPLLFRCGTSPSRATSGWTGRGPRSGTFRRAPTTPLLLVIISAVSLGFYTSRGVLY